MLTRVRYTAAIGYSIKCNISKTILDEILKLNPICDGQLSI